METIFKSVPGDFILSAASTEEGGGFRAWDAADEYAVDEFITGLAGNEQPSRILVINDSHGALTIPVSSKFPVDSMNDTCTAEMSIAKNLESNNIDRSRVRFLHSFPDPPGEVDYIIIKIPKSLHYLEYLLQLISSAVKPGTSVMGLGMVRNFHSSTVDLFEHYLGGVHTSLARKKARLIYGETTGKVKPIQSFPFKYSVPESGWEMINHANEFSFGRLDMGSRFFLDHFPRFKNSPERVIDLGCGDGILALKSAQIWPDSPVLCVDHSYMSVDSARRNFIENGFEGRSEFMVTDCLSGIPDRSADLILCNPPFHQGHSVGLGTAGRMFQDSYRVLKPGGSLFLVKNRHLGYSGYLEKLFSTCRTIASGRKYEVLKAVRD